LYSDNVNRPEPGKDIAKLYASHREAALAAFQAGYKSATATEKRLERAMGLFLLSLRRDPTRYRFKSSISSSIERYRLAGS
jgi:hypothetical protein